jgi:hypothetical protein
MRLNRELPLSYVYRATKILYLYIRNTRPGDFTYMDMGSRTIQRRRGPRLIPPSSALGRLLGRGILANTLNTLNL